MDHRQQPRYELETLVKIEKNDQKLLGTSVDVSLKGLSLELVTPIQSTEPWLISFRLTLKDRPITTWAAPVWSVRSGNHWRIGFEFKDLDSQHHTAIADYISSVWQKSHSIP